MHLPISGFSEVSPAARGPGLSVCTPSGLLAGWLMPQTPGHLEEHMPSHLTEGVSCQPRRQLSGVHKSVALSRALSLQPQVRP